MASVEALTTAYARYVDLPWDTRLAGQQKVWFALYAPTDERRLRARLGAFEVATIKAGHAWSGHDLTDEFARWLAAHEYAESFFEAADDLTADALRDFDDFLIARLGATLDGASEGAVVALSGVGSLFGLTRVSRLLEKISDRVRGRLLVFFPGERDGSNYRLLDARDGWNYLAVPITAQEGEGA